MAASDGGHPPMIPRSRPTGKRLEIVGALGSRPGGYDADLRARMALADERMILGICVRMRFADPAAIVAIAALDQSYD
jgi:hypothetical protein